MSDAVSADEARRLLGDFPAIGEETIELGEAHTRVLAADFVAPGPLPAWARSAMDGFAVRAADLPGVLQVIGTVPAGGEWHGQLAAGQAVAIATGGVLPAGADAVVMVEHARRDGDAIHVERSLPAGQHVIQIGEDIAEHAVLLPAGRRLRAADLAALAGFGVTRVKVFRRPRVAVLATGSEVVPPERSPARGQVRDMNSVALAAAVAATGGVATTRGVVADDEAGLAAALADALAGSDVVLIAGGSSVGVRDFTPAALARLGARVLFHGIAVRPGRPTLLAEVGGTPVVGLPGVPASALLVYTAFVAELIRRRGGETPGHASVRHAQLAVPVRSAPGREDWLRVRLDGELAAPLPGGAMSIGPLVAADGLVCIAAEVTELAAGDDVEVLLP